MTTQNLAELAPALRRGELPLLDYLDALEQRFTDVEPAIEAFLPEEGRFDRLRREAEALLAEHADPAARPPLFGVPAGIKDIFHVDGFPTRAGSRLPSEALAGPEAAAVAMLRRAGALIAGKTVSTEFAYFAPGPTRNPRNPEHTPGGSSSGSAAGVAAGLCPLALGSQTIGSTLRPAAYCGIVGFKPSYDRIPRDGIVPLAPSFDHVGIFTADAAGAELAASVLCRHWQPPGTGLHARNPKRPLRPVLGIPEGPHLERVEPAALAQFQVTCELLARAGFDVRPVAALADLDDVEARHRLAVAAETARVHAEWYPKYRDLYRPATVELIERGRGVSDEELAAALGGRQRLRGELTALMDRHGLDLWMAPAATGPAPRGLDSTGNPAMSFPWTYAGMPAVAVPSGVNEEGLPLAVQLIARFWADEALLAWAREVEGAVWGGEAAP
jgi:Asp-tRNA(Asn)/Glu-tRNA(Gln) amidotransferase A subunit family amidase